MLRIRPGTIEDCDSLGLITVTAFQSAFLGPIPEELLDLDWTPEVSAGNWRKGWSANTERGQEFLLAEDDGRPVGFAWFKPWAETEGFEASVTGLHVLPSCQGRGIGRALLREAARRLAERDARSLEIGCIRENPNCGFYRHLGGVEIGRRPRNVDRFETEEIFFGWRDINSLI